LADFEGKTRAKTLKEIFGYKVTEAAPHITVREVLYRIAPPYGYV
jgi:hypothetical protein